MRRAIGIGAQGLADLFHELKISFVGDEAKKVNKKIYEAIYFGCLQDSMELAKEDGTYVGYEGSPASKGILQFDLWNIDEKDLQLGKERWDALKKDIKKYGLRNSEVTALAPTASSSVRMGNNEMHEPYTRNIYVRQTIAGSMQIVNKHLVHELVDLGIWNEAVCNQILNQDGSVQGVDAIPADIQERYRTVYELPWKDLVDMQADRSVFVSQTSSYNHYTTYEESGPTAFTQKVIYAWKKGLKTLSYYQHTETASTAKKELGGSTVFTNDNLQTTNNAPKARWTPSATIVDDGLVTMAVGEVCEDCST
jgi:ribonucleoside-diphosphate reductase alpha chain